MNMSYIFFMVRLILFALQRQLSYTFLYFRPLAGLRIRVTKLGTVTDKPRLVVEWMKDTIWLGSSTHTHKHTPKNKRSQAISKL